MAGSGAGLNRVNATILTVNANASAVVSPLTAYGTLGVNDSGQVLTEAMNFTKWTFSLIGGGTPATYGITLYGTNDPAAYTAWKMALNPSYAMLYNGGKTVTLPATSWFKLPGPAEQSGTGAISNPITPTSPLLTVSLPLIAVRAVLTTAGTGGPISVAVEAVP